MVAEKYAAEIEGNRDALPDLMIKERAAYMFMLPTILNATNRIPGLEQRDSAESLRDLRGRHVSGLRPDRGTTYCDDGAAAVVRQERPGSQPLRACGMPLSFAELQIWDEDNHPVPPGRGGRDRRRVRGTDARLLEQPGFISPETHGRC